MAPADFSATDLVRGNLKIPPPRGPPSTCSRGRWRRRGAGRLLFSGPCRCDQRRGAQGGAAEPSQQSLPAAQCPVRSPAPSVVLQHTTHKTNLTKHTSHPSHSTPLTQHTTHLVPLSQTVHPYIHVVLKCKVLHVYIYIVDYLPMTLYIYDFMKLCCTDYSTGRRLVVTAGIPCSLEWTAREFPLMFIPTVDSSSRRLHARMQAVRIYTQPRVKIPQRSYKIDDYTYKI